MVIEPKSSNREIIKFTSASGTTLTILRGLSETSNFNDSGTGTGVTHAAGVQVAMKDVHYYFNKVTAAYRGEEVTGYNSFFMGDGNALSTGNRLWYAATSSVSAFWGLSSNGRMVVSEDGSTSYVISAGGSGVTAGDGIAITAGVVTTANLSTGGVQISAAKNVVGVSTGLNRNVGGLYVDQSSAFYWTGLHNFTDISIDSVQISASATEINQVADGVSSSVTAANLGLVTNKNQLGLLGANNAINLFTYQVIPLSSFWTMAGGVFSTNNGPWGNFESSGINWDANFSTMPLNGASVSSLNSLEPNDRPITVEWRMGAANGTTEDRSAGLGNATFGTTYNDATAQRVAFAMDGTTLYAVTCDGTTANTTNLSAASITVTRAQLYRIELTSGSATFYVNGTQYASILSGSALPSGTGTDFDFHIGGTANGEDLRIGTVIVQQVI